MDPIEWLDRFGALAGKCEFHAERFGEVEGIPLLAFHRPASERAPRIYLSAGIHGDEPAGPLALERLLDRGLPEIDAAWTICPLLNPRGFRDGTRHSPDGIDLNRDYLRRATPEVRAHATWIEELPDHDMFLSLHEDWEAEGFYLYEINTSGRISIADAILDAVDKVIARDPRPGIDDHRVTAPGLIRHQPEADEPENWPEAIYQAKRSRLLSYTFETPSTRPIDVRIEAHLTALHAAVRHASDTVSPT